MRKLLTFAAAVLASASMFAAEFTLFNGEGNEMPASTRQEDATTGFAYTFANFKTSFIDVSAFADHGSYANAIRYGGGTTSAKNYLLLEIPENYIASVDVVYGSSDSSTPSFGISTDGTKPNGSNCSEWNATVAAAATLYATTITDLEGGKSYYVGGSADKCILAYVRVILSPSCTDPELTVSPTEGTGFVGDPIDIAVTSKNQSKPINAAVTVDGVAGVYGTDFTYSASIGLIQAKPLKAGTFVITFTQASDGTYCDAEATSTFVISEKTPVTSFKVEGPTSARVGDEVTLTATDFNANPTRVWWVDLETGETIHEGATYTFKADAEGEVWYFVLARNEFNNSDEEADDYAFGMFGSINVTIGHNAKLSDLKVNGVTIEGFDGDILEYNLGEIGVYEPVEVTAIPADDPYATATVNPGDNNVLITVFAQDKTTYTSYVIKYTRKAATELVSISESTTWDWANAGSAAAEHGDATMPTRSEEFNFADVLINPAESFNAAALAGIAQFANRGEYFQGTQIKFNTTVPGTVVVYYQNTSNRDENGRRWVVVNDVKVGEGAVDQKDWYSAEANVAAGDVVITFIDVNDASTMLRINKIVFTKSEQTAIDNAAVDAKATKRIVNGQVIILRDGKTYNALGAEVK